MIADSLIKRQLADFQFAWQNGIVDQFTEFEIEIMRPVIQFARDLKNFSADETVIGPRSCHADVIDDSEVLSRRWADNYRKWYEAGNRIGQYLFPYEEFIEHTKNKYAGWYRIYGLSVDINHDGQMLSVDEVHDT